MIVHPWHGLDPGEHAPEVVDCIIEIPRNSRSKYELDKKTGLLRLDRVLYSAVVYPANYGFIPRTYCDDRDPLDILVLGQHEVVPLCIVTARPIGVMQMVDQDEEDDKIIAVHEHDPAFSHYRDIRELPQHTLYELQQFFEDYKKLEHKEVRIERFKGQNEARQIIETSLRLYQQSFAPDGSKRRDAPTLQSETLHSETPPRETLFSEAKHREDVEEAARARTPSRSARAEAYRRQATRLQADDEESALFATYQRAEEADKTRADAASGDAASGDAASGDAVSGDAASGDAVSGDAVSGDAVSGDAVSGEEKSPAQAGENPGAAPHLNGHAAANVLAADGADAA